MVRGLSGWLTGVVVLGLTLAAGSTPAGAQSTPGPEKQVTLNLKDVPLRSAIELLFTGTGLQYSIDPNVRNVPISLSVRDVTLPTALRLVTRQASTLQPGLTISRDGEVYTVRIRQPAPPSPVVAEEAPPEATESSEIDWEKIPVQFNSVVALIIAFGGEIIPTELDVLSQNGGGFGGGIGGGAGGGYGGGLGGLGGGFGGGLGGGFGGGFGGGLGGGFGGGGFGGGGFGGGGFGGGGFGGGGFGGGGFGGGGFGGGGFGGGGFGGRF